MPTSVTSPLPLPTPSVATEPGKILLGAENSSESWTGGREHGMMISWVIAAC